jgi:hypothetical protein
MRRLQCDQHVAVSACSAVQHDAGLNVFSARIQKLATPQTQQAGGHDAQSGEWRAKPLATLQGRRADAHNKDITYGCTGALKVRNCCTGQKMPKLQHGCFQAAHTGGQSHNMTATPCIGNRRLRPDVLATSQTTSLQRATELDLADTAL